MANDDKTLLSNLRKERDQLAKSKLPNDQKGKVQRALDLVIGDAQTLVTMRGALSKDMDEHQAKIKAVATSRKALSTSLKALHTKYSATADHRSQAAGALAEARKAKEGADAAARATKAYNDLSLSLLDFSPYQTVDGA